MLALGCVEGFLTLGDFLADGLELLRGLLGGFEGLGVALVRKLRPRLQVLRILAGIRRERIGTAGAFRRDALGRAHPFSQRGQRKPQLLRLLGLRLQLLLTGLHGLLLLHRGLQRRGDGLHLLRQHLGGALGVCVLLAQPHHLVSGELELRVAQLRLHRRAPLGGLRLAGQGFELLAQLVGEVGQAIQVRLHAGKLALRLLLAAPVLEHTRGLLDERAALLGSRIQDLGELALADDDVHLAADAGIGQ